MTDMKSWPVPNDKGYSCHRTQYLRDAIVKIQRQKQRPTASRIFKAVRQCVESITLEHVTEWLQLAVRASELVMVENDGIVSYREARRNPSAVIQPMQHLPVPTFSETSRWSGSGITDCSRQLVSPYQAYQEFSPQSSCGSGSWHYSAIQQPSYDAQLSLGGDQASAAYGLWNKSFGGGSSMVDSARTFTNETAQRTFTSRTAASHLCETATELTCIEGSENRTRQLNSMAIFEPPKADFMRTKYLYGETPKNNFLLTPNMYGESPDINYGQWDYAYHIPPSATSQGDMFSHCTHGGMPVHAHINQCSVGFGGDLRNFTTSHRIEKHSEMNVERRLAYHENVSNGQVNSVDQIAADKVFAGPLSLGGQSRIMTGIIKLDTDTKKVLRTETGAYDSNSRKDLSGNLHCDAAELTSMPDSSPKDMKEGLTNNADQPCPEEILPVVGIVSQTNLHSTQDDVLPILTGNEDRLTSNDCRDCFKDHSDCSNDTSSLSYEDKHQSEDKLSYHQVTSSLNEDCRNSDIDTDGLTCEVSDGPSRVSNICLHIPIFSSN